MAQLGAVVLAGGRSSRMGRAKADLEWHGSTLLRRVVGLAHRGVNAGPVVVVQAVGQRLPVLPPWAEVVEDAEPERGPLQGIASGLAALSGRADGAFVCATDLPFLHPAFVRSTTSALGSADVAVAVVGGIRQPLAAAYSTRLASAAAELLARGHSRAGLLLDGLEVTVLDEQALLADERLRRGDPQLESVAGVNDPAAYDLARARPAPAVTVQRAGAGSTSARAATLGAAASAVGWDLALLATVDGDQVVADPETPLAQGDVVTLLLPDA